jgi:hypothetical protein
VEDDFVRIASSFTIAAVLAAVLMSAACSDDKTPTPTSPAPVAATVSAPALEAPAADTQLETLRPTLTVRNATSNQAGARTYEFQISDSQSFTSALTSHVVGYAATVSGSAVPEGAGGTTSWTPPQDLQPTTVFYWRARAAQGSSTSPWSPVATFRTKLVG